MFCGPISCVASLVIFCIFWPLTCLPLCCPCDGDLVYIAPDGTRYDMQGRQVGVQAFERFA